VIRGTAGAVVALTLLGAAIGVQVVRDARFPFAARAAERILYVPSPAVMERLMLSFDALAADVYWIRAIQHYGGDRLSTGNEKKYELLHPLLDITTSLDPWFTIAYRFGAIFLAEPRPGGPGRPDLAVALLRKGIAAEPSKWQYPHDVGFVYYRVGDYGAAALWFRRASEVAGAPEWLGPLAATMLVRGGDRASSRFLWGQILKTADQDWLRATAGRALMQLDALDAMEHIEARIEAYDRRQPPAPLTWERLVGAGVLPGVPLDPTGTPFVLNPWWGTLSVAETSPLFPMPQDLPPAVRPGP
jgi:hypothetical protein